MTAVKFTNKKQKQIKAEQKKETISIMKLDFHGFPRLARCKGLTLQFRKK